MMNRVRRLVAAGFAPLGGRCMSTYAGISKQGLTIPPEIASFLPAGRVARRPPLHEVRSDLIGDDVAAIPKPRIPPVPDSLNPLALYLESESYYARLRFELENPDIFTGRPNFFFKELDKHLKGLREREFTVFTGKTGTGKTTFIAQYTLGYMLDQKEPTPTMWGSYEMGNQKLVKMKMRQFMFAKNPALGMQTSKSVDDLLLESLDDVSAEFRKLPLYFLNTKRAFDLGSLRSVVQDLGIKHMVLDNLQFIAGEVGVGNKKFDCMDDLVRNLRDFADEYDLHVTLIAHPRKENARKLTIQSLFGSGKLSQESDNVIALQLPDRAESRQTRLVQILKQREGGNLVETKVVYNPRTCLYEEISPNPFLPDTD
ncbi:Twinkle protein, mitochondrial [Porphyridium purpureum]|uniref:Twinkle protein, mitochondrial n=1 Tax=Porphyridium purpureum TaxID=35688 RepID=A0A5J4Z003_PORPP|nr:Twinkle protein, mitochondrial [Porphyridium purpureum]|eukprot:POR3226..scf208_2